MRAALAAASVLGLAHAATFNVTTGVAGKYYFDPPRVNASTGDAILFIFPPGADHSVVQSRADAACAPLDGGWRSAHFTLAPSAPRNATFLVNITDAAPVFFYCALVTEPGVQAVFDRTQRQPVMHCEQGMFGAINAADGAYDAYARSAVSLVSLTAFPDQPPLSLVTVSGTPTPTARPAPRTGPDHSDALARTVGTIVGVFAILGLVLWLVGKCRSRTQTVPSTTTTTSPHPAPVPHPDLPAFPTPAASRATPVNRRRDASPPDDELPAYEARGRDALVSAGDVEMQRLTAAPGFPSAPPSSDDHDHAPSYAPAPVAFDEAYPEARAPAPR